MPRFSECWRCGNAGDSVVCRACGVAKYCSNGCQRNDKNRHEAECQPVAIVKTCLCCRKSGPALRACTGCYRAFYCDVNCQKSHRKQHKADCNGTKEKIRTLAQRLSVYYTYRFQNEVPLAKHYYWGNYPAYDGINLLENEGCDYASSLNVLYLGVGDLRNVLLTCAALPDTYGHEVLFTLNDRESCILARLVLLLYMLIKGDPGVEKTVTEIWYSTLLSEQTYEYMRACLRTLTDCPCADDLKTKTAGLISINEIHLKELKNVWIRWHNLQVKGTTWIRKQRENEFRSDEGSYHGRVTYFNCIPQEHVKSAKKWMKDGVFERKDLPPFAENPTLTGYSTLIKERPYSYCIPSDVLPVTGWDYLEVRKFRHANSLVTMFGVYVENLLRKFMKKICNNQVRFQILLSDCMAIEEYIDKETTYDRILTSNLMDYTLLPNLLKVCSLKLNHSNVHATIVTETHNWTRDFCPEGDVSSVSNMLNQFSKLVKVALEDTKNPKQANDGGAGIREYLDNSTEFIDFLRALFTADSLKQESEDGRESTKRSARNVPTFKILGNGFRLRLRDGFRNENRITHFKMAVNRRRVTMITGLERIVEWVPLKDE